MVKYYKPRYHQCPSCLSVPFNPLAWVTAARQLVRPYEVADLLLPVPRWMLSADYTLANSVSAWHTEELRSGALRYIQDPPGRDVWQAPARTRWLGGGDCEDHALVDVSILVAGGGTADLVVGHYVQNGKCGGHAWTEGWDEQGWFLLEGTSGNLWRHQRPTGYHPMIAIQFSGQAMLQALWGAVG